MSDSVVLDRQPRRSVVLAAATVGLLVALSVGADWFWQAVRADGGGMSQWADFPGWQVPATEAAMAALLAIVFVASLLGVQRGYRSLAERRVQRRVTVMVALALGLVLGVGASLALPRTVRWASDRTAAAGRYAEQQQALQAQLRYHPVIPTITVPAAPPGVARHMLGPSDLGTGWFAAMRPEPSQGAPAQLPARWTALQAARTILQQAHRQGATTWVFDRSVIEFYWRFSDAPIAAAARDYLARQVTGFDRLNPSVVLRVGDRVIEIRILRGQSTPTTALLRRVARLAVTRAR